MDERRYDEMPSHHPTIAFMVWDYYDNCAIAYSYTIEQAKQVAVALNKDNNIKWSESQKRWIGE